MKNQKPLVLGVFTAIVFIGLQTLAFGQSANDAKLANVSGGGSSVRWDVAVANNGGTLVISAPDGRVFYREFKAGASAEINLTDKQLEGLPEGSYSYELRLRPVLSGAARKALEAARGNDDDPEAERAGRKRAWVPVLVQSGGFAILNGSIVVGGAVEDPRRTAETTPKRTAVISGNTVTRLRNHRLSLFSMPDIVQPDDVIIQGSACVGLDCVDGEGFNFDTIRLKENNTRIGFMDTSSGAGFPTNDWTIRANSSANGGGNFLAFVDQGASSTGAETGTIVFEVDAGAGANALRVSSSGKTGIRTGTPVLDLHITSSDTPAHRLEQTNQGGFTAQTWDIAGNEANFFVRDVTGGSRLPFRIRPGAPTSSIDINASGQVGIGTASPAQLLDAVKGQDAASMIRITNATAGVSSQSILDALSDSAEIAIKTHALARTATRYGVTLGGFAELVGISGNGLLIGTLTNATPIIFGTNGAERLRILSTGRVGIGTSIPDQLLSVNGDASKTGGNTWLAFSDERLKNIKGRFNTGLKAVMQLQPIRYEYKPDNALGLVSAGDHIGFGAAAVQKIIPEAVTRSQSGYLMLNSDPILWTMLNAIKEQQKEIVELKGQIQKLQSASHRRGTRSRR